VTARVCVEEGRHSVVADRDPALRDYLRAHLRQLRGPLRVADYEVVDGPAVERLPHWSAGWTG